MTVQNAGWFKPGTHWRTPHVFRDRDWLINAYVVQSRSTGDIAKEFGVTDAAILFWLRKHEIPRRSISNARAIKHWGVSGSDNPMFGRTGKDNPNWSGGGTPERQSFYASLEWRNTRKYIWKRDKAICRRCGHQPTKRNQLAIHHIVSFRVKELRAEPSNLALLCRPCHAWVHSRENENREFITEEWR